MMRKLIALFLSVSLFFVLCMDIATVSAEDRLVSGYCGPEATFILDKSTGHLVISGTGGTYDYFNIFKAHKAYIKTVEIQEGITGLGNELFFGCTEIKSVKIADSVVAIGSAAFYDCNSIVLMEFPISCSVTSTNAFYNVNNIKKTVIKKGTGIGPNYAQTGACNYPWYTSRNSIKEIVVEEGIQSIGNYMFYDCAGVEYISLPPTLTSIGNFSFSKCTKLRKINIPDGITSIPYCAFMGCSSLVSVHLGDAVQTIGHSAFEYCESLTDLELGENITLIDTVAFGDCKSLSFVQIPDNVTGLGKYAFQNCSSATIIVPSSITSLKHAFSGCKRVLFFCDSPLVGSGTLLFHSITDGEVIPPTCTEDGSVTGICSTCGQEVTSILPATGHNFDVVYDWADDYSKVVASSDCFNCGEEQSQTVERTSECQVLVEPSCETCGLNVYSAGFNNAPYSTQVKVVETEAKGHNYQFSGFEWDGAYSAEAVYVCLNDSDHTVKYEATVTTEILEEADCTEPGSGVSTASYDGHSETKTIVIEELGHDWSEIEVVTPATCEYNGTNERSCRRCGLRERYQSEPLGHDYQFSHFDWNDITATAVYVCSHSSEHTKMYGASVTDEITKEPECEENGIRTYTAQYGGHEDKIEVVIEPTGHDYEFSKFEWDQEYNAKSKYVCLRDNSHIMYKDVNVSREVIYPTSDSDGKVIYTAEDTYKGITYVASVQGPFDYSETPAPTVTTAKNAGSGILVEWDAVEGATGYVVYRRAMKSGETSWTTFARWNNTTSLSFLDTKVYEGTKYQYGIKAYYGNDPTTTTKLGPVGPMSTALIYSKKPAAPTKTTTKNTDDGIEISWDAVKGATGYVIYRRAWSSTTNGWTEFQRWNNTTSTTWTDTTVYAGTRYQYGIKAYYGNDSKNMAYVGSVGPLSTNVRITTRRITYLNTNSGNITVRWDASSVYTGYQVQYADNESFSGAKTITISDPKTTSTVFSFSSPIACYVRVRSYYIYNGVSYYGAWSEEQYAYHIKSD